MSQYLPQEHQKPMKFESICLRDISVASGPRTQNVGSYWMGYHQMKLLYRLSPNEALVWTVTKISYCMGCHQLKLLYGLSPNEAIVWAVTKGSYCTGCHQKKLLYGPSQNEAIVWAVTK